MSLWTASALPFLPCGDQQLLVVSYHPSEGRTVSLVRLLLEVQAGSKPWGEAGVGGERGSASAQCRPRGGGLSGRWCRRGLRRRGQRVRHECGRRDRGHDREHVESADG